jgi:hypothetical protein
MNLPAGRSNCAVLALADIEEVRGVGGLVGEVRLAIDLLG